MLTGVLGLTPDESSAYRELVALPAAMPGDLAGLLNVPVTEAAMLLAALERRGLAARDSRDLDRFVAVSPAAALGALLLERQGEIRRAEVQIEALEEVYRAASAGRGISGVVDVVHGMVEVGERFRLLQVGAREEVLAFVKAPATAVSAEQNTAEADALARGVRYRVVAERAALDEQGGVARVIDTIPPGEQVRTIDRVPLKLIVVDGRTAFLPISARPGPDGMGALVVHQSALLDGLLALFEAFWLRATPLATDPRAVARTAGTPIDDVDVRILELLLAGHTDQAVANQLGASLRTVQRRVQGLMALADVQTRMQLGWQAATRGWLSPPPDDGPR